MNTEYDLMYIMGALLILGIAMNVWLFMSSEDESSNDFN